MIREIFTESQLERHLGRLLQKTPSGVVDCADVKAVLEMPEARSPHGWFTAWMEQAATARLEARHLLQVGQTSQASRNYLRASEYYRAAAAAYWPERGDAAIADALRLHSECFRASLDLDGPVYRHISHAYAGIAATGYLARPRRMAVCASLLICCGPSDSTAEEQYLLAGCDAIERGWGVVLVDPVACEETISSSDDITHLVDQLNAAFTDFAGVEPTHRIVSGPGEDAGSAGCLVSKDDPPDISWMTPVAPEFERLQRRIRAPGVSS